MRVQQEPKCSVLGRLGFINIMLIFSQHLTTNCINKSPIGNSVYIYSDRDPSNEFKQYYKG